MSANVGGNDLVDSRWQSKVEDAVHSRSTPVQLTDCCIQSLKVTGIVIATTNILVGGKELVNELMLVIMHLSAENSHTSYQPQLVQGTSWSGGRYQPAWRRVPAGLEEDISWPGGGYQPAWRNVSAGLEEGTSWPGGRYLLAWTKVSAGLEEGTSRPGAGYQSAWRMVSAGLGEDTSRPGGGASVTRLTGTAQSHSYQPPWGRATAGLEERQCSHTATSWPGVGQLSHMAASRPGVGTAQSHGCQTRDSSVTRLPAGLEEGQLIHTVVARPG